jgi:hypothetical protein
MKAIAVICSALFLFATAAAADTCYQLSRDGLSFSRTPEVLCVKDGSRENTAEITLETGLFSRNVVTTFNFDLLQRARCIDCNQDVYGISNPSNSLFNDFQIRFYGNGAGEEEAGTVSIGTTRYNYRWFSN